MAVVSGPLLALSRSVRRFEKGEVGIAELQQSIVANASAVDGGSPGLLAAARQVEADLEHIQHAMLREEQHGAAVEALGVLLRELERSGAGGRREVPSGDPIVRVDRDWDADSAYIYLSDAIPHGTVARAVECGPVVLDFDRLDRLVGIEVSSASEHLPPHLGE
jgi:uncharacterized protein YuzE